MTEYELLQHADFPSFAITGIRVSAERRGAHIDFWFWVSGDLDRVAWPDNFDTDTRADDLWKHTCFEAFVQAGGQSGYCEFNWSPDGGWAAYAFDAYRAGMRNIEHPSDPIIGSNYKSAFEGGYQWSFSAIDSFNHDAALSIGISAVIEAKDGTKSYWALKHPPGKPDFHNPDCFIATLPAPAAP